RESGLGTPATRAQTLETLIERGYVRRDGKMMHATDKGIALIAAVDASVKSPALTGAWEAKLAQMEKKLFGFEPFMRGIEAFVRAVVARASGPQGSDSVLSDAPILTPLAPPSLKGEGGTAPREAGPPSKPRPVPPSPDRERGARGVRLGPADLVELLQKRFGF